MFPVHCRRYSARLSTVQLYFKYEETFVFEASAYFTALHPCLRRQCVNKQTPCLFKKRIFFSGDCLRLTASALFTFERCRDNSFGKANAQMIAGGEIFGIRNKRAVFICNERIATIQHGGWINRFQGGSL